MKITLKNLHSLTEGSYAIFDKDELIVDIVYLKMVGNKLRFCDFYHEYVAETIEKFYNERKNECYTIYPLKSIKCPLN